MTLIPPILSQFARLGMLVIVTIVWAHDLIAFYSERVGNAEILVIDADGSRVTRDPWYSPLPRRRPRSMFALVPLRRAANPFILVGAC